MDYSRQQNIFKPSEWRHPIHIIGAGATGSWVALILAKLGCDNITVYDFDKVEEHNLPNQFYQCTKRYNSSNPDAWIDIGRPKVERLAGNVSDFAGISITARNIRVDGKQKLDGVVFMLTDTMKSRKEIWDEAIKYKVGTKLLIETRMGLSDGRIYTIDPMNVKQITAYEKTFYKDEEAAVSACGTYQSVITTAMSIASMAVRQMINWHNGKPINHELLYDFENNQIIPISFE